MDFRRTVLATALAILAFAALPAAASANPKFDFEGSTHFTVEGGEVRLTSHFDPITCGSVTGTGEFEENGQTGTIQFTFHGCKEEFGFNCTTSGQPTGTITTNELPFHLVTLTEEETPGMLITPEEGGDFATYACFIIARTLTGNGIIGDFTAPGYDEESDELTFDFECKNATEQAYMTHDGDPETDYDLVADIGGESETVCWDIEAAGTFANGDKATLTHGE